MASQLCKTNTFAYACERYMDTVYRVAVHNTRAVADAEDVTQSVFEALLKSTKDFQSDEHLKAWLIRVTLNQCRNLHRAQAREAGPLPEDLHASSAGGESVLCEVRALPEKYRNAIYLHYYEGYTAAEIAQIMGSSVNTALSWLRRGREELKKRMIGGFEDE